MNPENRQIYRFLPPRPVLFGCTLAFQPGHRPAAASARTVWVGMRVMVHWAGHALGASSPERGHRMAVYGYARVSTQDQDPTLQVEALKAAGCVVIRAETASGARRDGRTELQVLFDFLQPGDTLMVTRIDRLARS